LIEVNWRIRLLGIRQIDESKESSDASGHWRCLFYDFFICIQSSSNSLDHYVKCDAFGTKEKESSGFGILAMRESEGF